MMGFTWDVIEKDMEGLARRFRATSKNLANANTPGYERGNVSFEDELKDVIYSGRKMHMTITNAGHIPSRPMRVADVSPAEIKVKDEMYRLDENNVDPEREMSVLSETRMMYSAMSRFAAKKLGGLRTAIAGR